MSLCPYCGGPLDPRLLCDDIGFVPVEVCRRCQRTQEREPTPPEEPSS